MLKPDQMITYSTPPGRALQLHIFSPSGHDSKMSMAAILFFHGGGWNGGNAETLYRQSRHLAQRGMIAISAEYRTQSSHGTTPFECVEDALSAFDWVRQYADELSIDPQRIAAGGGSAGAHLATTIACRHMAGDGPSALVLFNPVIDNGPEGYGYERVGVKWKEFSPLENLHAAMPPTLFMVGTEDELVPVATAKRFRDRLDALGVHCELNLYEGFGHAFYNKDGYDVTLRDTVNFLSSLGYCAAR